MKLNQGLVLAAALVVGSLAVTGCSKSADEDTTDDGVTTEQASVADGDQGTVQAGFEQDARGFRGGRGHAGRGHARGAYGHAGVRHGGRGFRRGERGEHGPRRAWYRFW